jgi:hypothetical protein
MAKLSFHRLARALGALSLLAGLAACVAPHPRHYGGGYGRPYAYNQPVHRGGYHPGWRGGPPRRWH